MCLSFVLRRGPDGHDGGGVGGKRRSPRVTLGPSSAISTMPPELTTTMEDEPKPEYVPLQYMEVEVRDKKGGAWTMTRGLLDSGSQGSCVNQPFSRDVLTTNKLKSTPTTMIMADGNNSPAGPITHYNPVAVRIARHKEQLALDTTSLSHDLIFGMPGTASITLISITKPTP